MLNMYASKHKSFSDDLLDQYPDAAPHGEFYVIGEVPTGIDETDILPLYKLGLDETGESGLTPTQFLDLVTTKLAQVYVGQWIIFTKPQGRLLKAEHPAFKSKEIIHEAV